MPSQPKKNLKSSSNLALILGGLLIVVLIIGGALIWSNRDKAEDNDANEKNTITLEQGTTFVKSGDSEFKIVSNDYELEEGDQLKTEKDAMATIYFANQNVARISGNTEVTLENIPENKEDVDIAVVINKGSIWSNVYTVGEKDANYIVTTESGIFKATGTVFNVGVGDSARAACYALDDGIEGKVKKKIKDEVKEVNKTKIKQGYYMHIDPKKLPKSTKDALKLKKIKQETKDIHWFKWNNAKDQEYYAKLGCDEKVKKTPGVYIYYPKTGATTTKTKVALKGSTTLDTTVTVNGKKIENKNGIFKTTVSIKMGKNTIKIVATDKDKKVSKKTLSVTRKEEDANPTAVNINGYAAADGNHISWSKNNDSDFASYKLQRLVGYGTPTSTYITISNRYSTAYTDASVTSGKWYSYRVVVVDKGGNKTYGNVVKIKAKKTSSDEEGSSGTFSAYYSGGKVYCSWNKYTGSGFNYYKIVGSSTNSNPKYPEDGYLKAISDVNTTSAVLATSAFSGCSIESLTPAFFTIAPGDCPVPFHGTVYMRLTTVTSGGKIHSNVVTVVIP